MIKLAIPIKENKLSEKLRYSSYYEIAEIKNNEIVKRFQLKPDLSINEKLCNWIEKNGITHLVVHHADKSFMDYFSDTKINLFIGIKISTSDEIIDQFVNGTLKSNSSNF